jgi:transposase InsO family protein
VKQERYRPELALRVGRIAVKEAKNRGVIKLLASVLDVAPQTIHRWKRHAKKESPPLVGRPRISPERCEQIKKAVNLEMARQGNPGWRAISNALPECPIRLVQRYVAEVKLRRRRASRKRIADRRISTEVLAREAIWTMDGTHLGRENGKAIEAQVIKDRGSLAYRAIRTGAPSDAMGVVRVLEAAGEPPLVLSSDNGSIYLDHRTQAWLRANKVVHLKSLPRTPQHNGAAEIGIREVKELAGSRATLESAARLLNNCRHRGSRGYKTPAVLDAEMAVAYHKVDRAVFYEKCMERLSELERRPMKWRDRRMSEREVIFATLEEYGLIKRTGGVA